MNLYQVYNLLSEVSLKAAENSIRRGTVLLEYNDERYAVCRPFSVTEAGVDA